MLKKSRAGEAPLPLVLAGAASLTAMLVIVGSLLTRKSDQPPPPSGGTKYIQSLEGVMESFDRRKSSTGGTPGRATAAERANTGSSSGPPALASTAVHKKMMKLVASPDILIRRLGHRDGDFVFSKTRGWLKFDPSGNALKPISHGELPQDLKDRYPSELFPSRGKNGRDPSEEGGRKTGGGGGSVTLASGGSSVDSGDDWGPDGQVDGAGGGADGSGAGGAGGAGGSGRGRGGAGGAGGAGAGGGAGGAAGGGAAGAGGAGGSLTAAAGSITEDVSFLETPVLKPTEAP